MSSLVLFGFHMIRLTLGSIDIWSKLQTLDYTIPWMNTNTLIEKPTIQPIKEWNVTHTFTEPQKIQATVSPLEIEFLSEYLKIPYYSNNHEDSNATVLKLLRASCDNDEDDSDELFTKCQNDCNYAYELVCKERSCPAGLFEYTQDACTDSCKAEFM